MTLSLSLSLSLSPYAVLNEGQWSVGDTLDSFDLTTERYQQKYLQQLQSGRREIVLVRELQQKEREKRDMELQLHKKERELRLSYQLLQEKEREYQETVHRIQQEAATPPQGKDRSLDTVQVSINTEAKHSLPCIVDNTILTMKPVHISQYMYWLSLSLSLSLVSTDVSVFLKQLQEKDSYIAQLTRRLHSRPAAIREKKEEVTQLVHEEEEKKELLQYKVTSQLTVGKGD